MPIGIDERRLFTGKNLIFYCVEIIVVDNTVKDYCIKTFTSHKNALNNLNNDIGSLRLTVVPDQISSIYFEETTRSDVFGQIYELPEKNWGFFSKRQYSFVYLEMCEEGQCFVPLSFKELKKMWEDRMGKYY